MFGAFKYRELRTTMTRGILPRLFHVLTAWSKVTVLLFIVGAAAEVRADDVTGTDIHLFEFTSEFYMVRGNGRIDGLMASDGSQYRIAIY